MSSSAASAPPPPLTPTPEASTPRPVSATPPSKEIVISIISDIRKYADTALGTALEQGRTAPVRAQELVTGLTTDARERTVSAATDVRDLTADLLETLRRQAFAALGAGDVAIDKLARRADELPSETVRAANRVADGTRDTAREGRQGLEAVAALTRFFAEQAQAQLTAVANDLLARGENAVEGARSFDMDKVRVEIADELASRLSQVKAGYEALADRGERVATDLRREPTVLRLIGDADQAAERAADQVTSIAEKVRTRAVANRRSVSGKKAAATRAANPRKAAIVKAAGRAGGAARSTAAKVTPATKATSAKKTTATTTTTATKTTKTTATKAPAVKKTQAVKKTPAKKAGTTALSARATKAAAGKTTAGRTTARKTTARKTTARKAAGRTAPARKSTASV